MQGLKTPATLSQAMSTNISASNLIQAVTDLNIEWQQAKSHWRDVKSEEFERRYLEKLSEHVAKAKPIIDEIEKLLRKVRQDCE